MEPIAIAALYPLVQTATTVLLIRRVVRPAARLRAFEKVSHILALTVGPTAGLLIAITTFTSDWKGGHSHGWFGVFDVDEPGAWILPLWGSACVGLFIALLRERWLYRSKVSFIMMATLAAICFWYVGTFPIYTGITGDNPSLVSLSISSWQEALAAVALALVPAWPCINLILLMICIWRRGEMAGRAWPFGLGWGGALAATIAVKCYEAIKLWESLPDQEPSRCFVVSAAAKGHPRLVGSTVDPAAGRPVNVQLLTLQAFEARLARDHARLHRAIRGVYNVVGPAVAGRIRSRPAADVVYVILKPAELLGACYLRCTRGPKGE